MMPNKDNPTTPRGHALSYYDQFSWFVIPTDPGAKKPYYGFTYRDRYGDHLPTREVAASWEEWDKPGVRVGTRTGAVSGIIVLDVDSKEAHDFIKSKQHPICPMVQSPREGGGLHLYFKHPGFYVKSTVALGGVEGLDIRGDGGIVVLPPSPDHKSGRAYEWIIPPDEVPIPEVPAWVLELLEKQSRMKEPLDAGKIMEGIPEGQRDTELNRLAGWLRHKNFPKDVAIDVIEKAAERCKPPFNRAEAKAKVVWAFTHYEAGEDPGKLVFSFSEPNSTENGKSGEEAPVVLASLEKPGPRQWLVEGLIPMKYPTTMYGSGGVSKSYLALSLGTSIAAAEEEWMGYQIKGGAVLYLDFELEIEEQTRRAYEVAAGMGYEKPPENLLYQSAAGVPMVQSFQNAAKWCKEYDVKLLIVDSTGLALEGDSESARDVIAFFREVVGSFVQIGTCVLLIDHQSKLQQGDNYQKKSAFGSGYKEYLARSAIQVELVNRGDGEITVRFRQKKTNFGSIVDPFEVRVYFRDEEVSAERIDLDDGDMATEESIGAEERTFRAIRYLDDATPMEVAEYTGLAPATTRKQFSMLKKQTRIEETGETRDGAKVCKVCEKKEIFSFSRPNRTENEKTGFRARPGPHQENLENTEITENRPKWEEL